MCCSCDRLVIIIEFLLFVKTFLVNTYMLNLFFLLFRKGCNTNGGDHPDVPCVFPFNYNGITYTECTDVDNDGVAWCATSTLYGNTIWGYSGNCEDSCPGVLGNSI